MQGKITLEDHFATKTTLGDSHIFGAHVWSELGPRLLDFQDQRLRFMDAAGIEIMIASLNAPAIQAIPDIKRATEVTREANDVLAREIAKRPDRFVGVAALAMQDPDNAAAELERCVKDLGFRGALVNGFSQVGSPDTAVYYDLPQYRTFWRVVERLDVPFYLHPRNPLPGSVRGYEGHDWLLGPNWAFHAETAVHALRLIGSGLFDELPRLQIILGHLGEALPFLLPRIDRYVSRQMKAPRTFAETLRRNFYFTTSGAFPHSALQCTIEAIGIERLMFAVDWPFLSNAEGRAFIDSAPIDTDAKALILEGNARRLLRL